MAYILQLQSSSGKIAKYNVNNKIHKINKMSIKNRQIFLMSTTIIDKSQFIRIKVLELNALVSGVKSHIAILLNDNLEIRSLCKLFIDYL